MPGRSPPGTDLTDGKHVRSHLVTMSPIGRVFIVLNLLLAGAFVGFAGTHLQKQHFYKDRYDTEVKGRADDKTSFDAEKARLEAERTTLEIAKTAAETQLGATSVRLDASNDELKSLRQQYASMEGDLKQMRSHQEATSKQIEAAFNQAKEAYAMAIADQKTRDEAVRAKDASDAENRELKTAIANLEESVKTRDVNIAGLEKERAELQLLVSVAQQGGFMPSMAAPALAGTVSHVANKLCTITITDNPGEVDIADQIKKRSFSFAIFDEASGYKGEAVATAYHPSENAVTCNLMLIKGDIKTGDKASTKTP